jgi:tetratricopeptide (TPR) repeat protein
MKLIRAFLLIPALLLAVSACGSLRMPAFLSPAPDTVPAPTAAPTESQAALQGARQSARQNLAAGRYGTALEGLRRERESGTAEKALAAEYLEALNGVLDQAGHDLERDEPALAGPQYQAALQAYPHSSALAAEASLSRQQVSAKLKECADRLMDRGLTAYRSGDLDKAIEIWKQIGVFCPDHQASMQALRTAEVQLANLRKIHSKD